MHRNQFVPRYVQSVSRLKFDCISSEVYEDNLKMCLGRISIASYRTCSQNFLNCVWAKFHLDLLPKVLRHFQNGLQPKLKCIFLKLVQDMSKLCLSWKSMASCRKYPKTIWNGVWVEVHFIRVENVLRISHFAF